MTGRIDQFDIAEVEQAVQYMFCREPKAVLYFAAPAADILNPETRLIVGAAQDLHDRGKEPTIELISAATGIAISELERWGRMVTARMREDWLQYAELIRLAALKRESLPWFDLKRDQLLRTPLLDVPAFLSTARAEFAAMASKPREKEASDIGDIIDEMENSDVVFADPIATGIDIMDQVLMGGVRPNEVHVIGGAMKGGKSTVLRNMALNMDGVHKIHIAADGGNKFKHTCYYTGMVAKRYCLEAGYATRVHGFDGDALHPNNIAIWYTNRNPRREKRELLTPIAPQVEETILAAREELKRMRERGQLALYDSKMLGFSIDNLLAFIEAEYYRHDAQVVFIDHAGKFGDKRKYKIFERFEMTAQLLVELFNRLPMVGIILSQRNAEGVKKHNAGTANEDEDTDYSANLQGGKTWEEEAHSVWIVRRPKGKRLLQLKPKLVRENENDVTTASIPYDPPTGLILPPGYSQVNF